MSSIQEIQNNDSEVQLTPDEASVLTDIRKIFQIFFDTRGVEGSTALCPFFDEGETTSRARSILHAIFLNAYLTSHISNGVVSSYVRAFGSTQNTCRNHPCQFVIGMAMYRYFSQMLNLPEKEGEHFIYRNVGVGKGDIHPAASGCGYYHIPEEIAYTKRMVDKLMNMVSLEMEKDDFLAIPRRINEFINKSSFETIPKKPMQVFQFYGPRQKIAINIPNFNDKSIFSFGGATDARARPLPDYYASHEQTVSGQIDKQVMVDALGIVGEDPFSATLESQYGDNDE